MPCPIKDACSDFGPIFKPYKCSKGYTGNLCFECDRSHNYAKKTFSDECISCD